jgi:hypothetical protein
MIVLEANVQSEPLKYTPDEDEHVLAWFASLDEEAGASARGRS